MVRIVFVTKHKREISDIPKNQEVASLFKRFQKAYYQQKHFSDTEMENKNAFPYKNFGRKVFRYQGVEHILVFVLYQSVVQWIEYVRHS